MLNAKQAREQSDNAVVAMYSEEIASIHIAIVAATDRGETTVTWRFPSHFDRLSPGEVAKIAQKLAHLLRGRGFGVTARTDLACIHIGWGAVE